MSVKRIYDILQTRSSHYQYSNLLQMNRLDKLKIVITVL